MSAGRPDSPPPAARPPAGHPPLTARSVLLSVLLGSHPPHLPVRVLVRVADLFGIAEGTARVALSRLASDGDVVADNGSYRLSPRLLERQRHQDASLRPAGRAWRGGWEMVVAVAGAGPADRALMDRMRLAELRPGVWVRPDNLERDGADDLGAGDRSDRAGPSGLPPGHRRFVARPGFADPSPAAMAAELWDLDGWAATATTLMRTMDAATTPADRFVTAAAMVRHLRADPVLPASLLPAGWPGDRLRAAYGAYRRELGVLLQQERDR